MRTTALIMAIIGGVFGVIMALLALAVGGIADDSTVKALAAAAFAFSIIGMIGGGITGTRAGWGASLLLVAGIGIIVSISYFGILPGIFFLLGSLSPSSLGVARRLRGPSRSVNQARCVATDVDLWSRSPVSASIRRQLTMTVRADRVTATDSPFGADRGNVIGTRPAETRRNS